MTSIADPGVRPARGEGGGWRALALAIMLGLAAWQGRGPWGALWVLVPLVTGVSLLLAWRFGGWATLAPVVVFGAAALAVPVNPLWLGWLPAAALAGVWMGLREEGGGLGFGQRAWMLLPVLVVAAAAPWVPGYAQTVAWVTAQMRETDGQVIGFYRQLGMAGERLQHLEATFAESARIRERVMPFAMPTALFLWVGLLVQLGRSLASSGATLLHWPRLARARLADWRLPDGVLWVLLVGLALIVSKLSAWAPTAWTLTLNALLGYCLQGVAVVQCLLLARGFPSYMVLILFAFVFVMAWPAFLLLTACVGVSDVWLDYRRMERTSGDEGI